MGYPRKKTSVSETNKMGTAVVIMKFENVGTRAMLACAEEEEQFFFHVYMATPKSEVELV